MATFGQGINANLGAIDYSAYQRGAAQGAQSIGQGLAGLGQGIGVVVKERKEYKNNVASAKKLIAGLKDLKSIPEDVKTRMGALGEEIDNPNISLSEQSAIATRLSSLADGIFGAGLQQSFKDAQNTRIAEAVNASMTKQTPEAFMASANQTLAGNAQPAFESELDMSKLGTLLGAGMSAADVAGLSTAITKRKGDPKLPYEIARLKAAANKYNAEAEKAGQKPTGYKTEADAFASMGPGANSTNTGTRLSGGYYYPYSLEANREGSVTTVTAPNGKEYPALILGGQLVHPKTKIPIYGSKDFFGQTNTPTFNSEWLKLQGIETTGEEEVYIRDPKTGKFVLKNQK